MKQKLLRVMLLPAILCALLVGVAFNTAGSAHAATLQSQVSQSPAIVSRTSCQDSAPPVVFETDYNLTYNSFDEVCFKGSGSQSVNLYNDYSVYTGGYTLTWNWTDCNGATHHSVKGPQTVVTAANTPGGFAGYELMCDITYIALS